MMDTTFLIIGGGIAGVSCAETLAYLSPETSITLVSQSSLIKAVTNLVPLGKSITKFDVEEIEASNVFSAHKSVQIIQDTVKSIFSKSKYIICSSGVRINFKFLCICTGGQPKLISQAKDHNDRVIGIRDTESVSEFQKKILKARKIIIVGNGGIASELVHEISGVEIIWVIKDKHISSTFVDPGASEFFQSKLISDHKSKDNIVKRMRYCDESQNSQTPGAALGPDWHDKLNLTGSNLSTSKITIKYESEIIKLENGDDQWPIYASLTNDTNTRIGCDFIISATGVIPATSFIWDIEPDFGPDNGLSVNEMMETSLENIYAAGDVCYANWKPAEHWFQMRLWSQARQMGSMAAKAMNAKLQKEDILQDFCFEIFSHVTKLFGYKVVLLGKYNAQGLGQDYEIIVRVTPNLEYIKLVLVNGKLQGGVLIGETGLEETFENLILNQLDVSMYGEDLLNPDIDIEDYFD